VTETVDGIDGLVRAEPAGTQAPDGPSAQVAHPRASSRDTARLRPERLDTEHPGLGSLDEEHPSTEPARAGTDEPRQGSPGSLPGARPAHGTGQFAAAGPVTSNGAATDGVADRSPTEPSAMDENAVANDALEAAVTDPETTVRVPMQRVSLRRTAVPRTDDSRGGRTGGWVPSGPAVRAARGAARPVARHDTVDSRPAADEDATRHIVTEGLATRTVTDDGPAARGGALGHGPSGTKDALLDGVLAEVDAALDGAEAPSATQYAAGSSTAPGTATGPTLLPLPPGGLEELGLTAPTPPAPGAAIPAPRTATSTSTSTPTLAPPADEPADGHGRPDERQPYRAEISWERKYTRLMVCADLAAGALAAALAYLLRFGGLFDFSLMPMTVTPYLVVTAVFPLAWLATMSLNRAYEDRFLGGGSEEFRRVLNAAVRLTALVAVGSYATKAEVARAYLLIVFPVATILTLVGRAAARALLHRMRRAGRCQHRVLVVGAGESAAALVRLARRDPSAGWSVVGVCLDRAPGRHSHDRIERTGFDLFGIPIVGTSEALQDAIRLTDATTVAISPQMDGERLRRALWALEGSNVDVLVSSAVTDVTGPRIHLRPVAGLPLLHIEEPELTGTRRLMKGLLDRGVAFVSLTLLSPLLLGLALAVRLTSKGPAIFKQIRVGVDGREFTMFKFRSMYVDAEARLTEVLALNDREDDHMFKAKDDPRITRVGKFLRKWSLDEVPQLLNVLNGTMSLVGPRPPLPREVARYADDVHRRLMVKPGLTGLWQVSGRSDLPTDEAVRLDLRYVENWSLAMDLIILWRTVFAVLKREGAY